MERAAGIVRAQLDRRPVVVVSAMGKTTNKLLAIAAAAVKGERDQAIAALNDLRDFHLRESAGLPVGAAIEKHFEELAGADSGSRSDGRAHGARDR